MGKNLIQQKRGKGSPTFRITSFRFRGRACHILANKETLSGEIKDLVKCPGHSSPLAEVVYGNKEVVLMQAPEDVKVGDIVTSGENAEVKNGNTLPLKNIPEGTLVYNIESVPGDGGKFARTSGGFAKIVAKTGDKVTIILPSSKKREFTANCRATVGVIAGAGRTEKPFMKAGFKFHATRARNRYWPITSATSMNAVSHPFGGRSSANKGRPTQSSRNASPGRKVGKIAPRRTGYQR